METELMTVPEVADTLRLAESTIRAWILQRRIPFIKLSRLVRIRRSDVQALVEAKAIPSQPGPSRRKAEQAAEGGGMKTEKGEN